MRRSPDWDIALLAVVVSLLIVGGVYSITGSMWWGLGIFFLLGGFDFWLFFLSNPPRKGK